jgi:uncharacterized protein with FMN-binding domain
MAKKMPGRLVALSASAVAVIYLTGLVSTQPAADSVAVASAGSASAVVATPAVSPTIVPTTVATAIPGAPTGTTYANGTYSGGGTSRFGKVNVSVTIAAGRISNVQITSVTTKYPAARIASLPALVMQGQTANVNVVTGATYSSEAFKQAVQHALALAVAS